MILGAYITATAPGGSPVELRDDTLVGASITQGSAGLLEAVEPATLSLTILDPDGAWRNLIGFTTRLEVAIGGSPGSWTNPQTRFVGTVTDMRVTYDEAWLLSVIAVGPKMASRTILVDPRPQETAAAEYSRREMAGEAEMGRLPHARWCRPPQQQKWPRRSWPVPSPRPQR